MDTSENASAHFKQGYNCSQSVFAALAPELGLDEATALKIASGFGGGVGRSGEVCGAVSGAVMALGLRFGGTSAEPQVKEKMYAVVQDFIDHFRKAGHDGVTCRGLLHVDISIPEGRQAAREHGLFDGICPSLVGDAAQIVKKMLSADR
jgi:C_GCAxxG_C_C family probable redox protein